MSGTLAHPHQHHTVYCYILLCFVVAIVVIGALLVKPYINVSSGIVIPVTGSQFAYTEYMRGEKVMYMLPDSANNALLAFRQGEKILYARTVDSSEALSAYRIGEKHVMSALHCALLYYRLGEKQIP